MLVSELLIESIHISPKEVDSVYNAVIKWQSYLQNENISEYMSEDDYKKYTNKLRASLQIVIRNIFKHYIKPHEELQHLSIKNKPISSHRLGIEIWGYGGEADYNEQGSVSERWHAEWRGNETILTNDMNLKITELDIANISKHDARPIINRLVATITHETTHLIQTLKSYHQSIYNDKYALKLKNDNAKYLGNSAEIDAFAQSTATHILLSGKMYNDIPGEIKTALQMIRFGVGTTFGKDVIRDSGQYNRYHQEFKTFAKKVGDIPVHDIRRKIWRRYNKKLVEKLLKYQEYYNE